MKNPQLLLVLILASAFLVRLYRIDNPIADWHSWRQTSTSAVSRNFLKSGFDLLHPRYNNLIRLSPDKEENLQGYHFAEFPLYNFFQAGLAKLFPFLSLEIWGRMVSIISSLISTIFLYLIVKKYLNKRIGLLAAAVFAFLPFNIFYSRTILPEPTMIAFSLGAIYFLEKSWVFSALLAAFALLLKPFAVFIIFPSFYLFRKKISKNLFICLFVYLFICILPVGLWRLWMDQFPEGIPENNWLLNANNIRLSGAFFYWIFADRISRLILGYWGLIPLSLGFLVKPGKNEGWFFHLWLLSTFAYFWIIAGGNVQHDYYQIPFLPIAAVFLAKGINYLLFEKNPFNHYLSKSLIIVSIGFSLAFSWYFVRDFFNINNIAIVNAGQAVDRLVPKDAKVIAPYGGDTTFLYYTNRQGWPHGIEIEKMIGLGATHYVNVNFDEETQWVISQFEVLEKTDQYVVAKLQ